MGYILRETSISGLTGKNKKIEEMIETVEEHIRKKGIISKEFEVKKLSFRMDCTDEKHTVDGAKEDVIKIQVQSKSDTFASVTIRKSAADRIDDDPSINDVVAKAIRNSYEKTVVYEISYTEGDEERGC